MVDLFDCSKNRYGGSTFYAKAVCNGDTSSSPWEFSLHVDDACTLEPIGSGGDTGSNTCTAV
jgi:hypothetical protein